MSNIAAAAAATVAASTLTERKLSSSDAFAQLAPAWNDLVYRLEARSFFLTPAWFQTWWEYHARGRELGIIVLQDGERVVGIAPIGITARFARVFMRSHSIAGIVPCTKLEFVSMMRYANAPLNRAGSLLLWEMLKQSLENGVHCLNLIWGNFAYQRRWATAVEPHPENCVLNRTRMARLLHFFVFRLRLHRPLRYAINGVCRMAWRLGAG